MATDTLDLNALKELQSLPQSQLLDIIDRLRSQGIDKVIDLPQLIVCGDQSAGKSSVLEAISTVKFPTNDNLCTLFATELVLRRAPTNHNAVSIRPGPSRTEEEAQRLREFTAPFTSSEDFPALIEQAKHYMKTCGRETGAFSQDVLCVESSGPDRPHLTIVDLPGLIHTENRKQTKNDIALVHELVKSYMQNPRSIILAIVSAKNDLANQIVLELAKEADLDRSRTLGIITKPDTIDGLNSEQDWLRLAMNKDVVLHLGWHILKNRDFQAKDTPLADRDAAEAEFFSKGVWADLPRDTVGIKTLRLRLTKVFLQQICSDLPKVKEEIESAIADCQAQKTRLGDPRPTAKEQQQYLTSIAQSFEALVQKATNGNYNDPFFDLYATSGYNPEPLQKRLRATVEMLNREFCAEMYHNGHTWQIVSSEEEADGRSHITRLAYLEHIKDFAQKSQGLNLPGTVDPLLIGPLFREQSQAWQRIAIEHVERVWTAARICMECILERVTNESTYSLLLTEHIEPLMEKKLGILQEKLQELMLPHQRHASTYDPDWKSGKMIRHERFRNDIRVNVLRHFGMPEVRAIESPEMLQGDIGVTELVNAISPPGFDGVDTYSCADLLDDMQAYYKIAMRSFIDNVAALAIENCLMMKLPDILSPPVVVRMSDEDLELLAGEPEDVRAERERLVKRLETLENGLRTCRRYIGRGVKPRKAQAASTTETQVLQNIPTIVHTPAVAAEDPSTPLRTRRKRNDSAVDLFVSSPRGSTTPIRSPSSLSEPPASRSRSDLREWSEEASPRDSIFSSGSVATAETTPETSSSRRHDRSARHDSGTWSSGSPRPPVSKVRRSSKKKEKAPVVEPEAVQEVEEELFQ